jgi:cytochrome c peroxidase
MKKLVLILIILIVTVGNTIIFCKSRAVDHEKEIEQTILTQIDSFSSTCTKLQTLLTNGNSPEEELQNQFLSARLAYKKFEWAAEYFVPETSGLVNGPPVEEVEMPDLRIIKPSGLQVIEGFLFPVYDSSKKREIIAQLFSLQSDCENFRSFFNLNHVHDPQVFDGVKLEVFRIMTLGISGFDNPMTLKSMAESAASFESLQKVLEFYIDKSDSKKLMQDFENTIAYLKTHTDFNFFNRMEFIIAYCNPITSEITDLEERLKITGFKYNRLLNQDARTLFDPNAFNVNAYAPDHSSFISTEKIALGKLLFSDPVLSGSGTRSCQSCHQPEKEFTDGLTKNTIIGKNELLGRNTPTLINAALQPALFYDLRVNSLEEQSHSVVQSEKEMHGSMSLSVKRLWNDIKYRQMFLTAFPNEDKSKIDTFEVMNAIGSYIRSLVFLNSRFDLYMQGNKTALNAHEINGFNLFMGKAKCATCHFMPLFNGNLPPAFQKMEAEVIGVPEKISGQAIDPDLGRYNIIRVESFRHAFKIPTVRNAARTGPYMHNGVFSSLDQVLDFYNEGGGVGSGIRIDNQTLPLDKLGLTEEERKDIIAFIGSLDSKMNDSITAKK